MAATLLLSLLLAAPAPFAPPERVSVLPVCFVPADRAAPSPDQLDRLQRHLAWARRRYQELLGQTFAVADRPPLVHRGGRTLEEYRTSGEGGAPAYVAELLEALGTNRFACPYVFVIVVMNPDDAFPGGGGRPLNGGYNHGGGVVILSSRDLDAAPNLQSTLQHELGHAFGLLHVDAYGRDMATDASLMSYNPAHHTNGFEPSATPGAFGPEDRRGLALNQRAYPGLTYTPDVADPPVEPLRWLGPMRIPGQPSYKVEVQVDADSIHATRAENMLQGRVVADSPETGFDAGAMWHSDALTNGWARVILTFPVPVTLDGILICSEHSGRYHRAATARLDIAEGSGRRVLAEERITEPDAWLRFEPTTATVWRLGLRAGPSRQLCLRGLRFVGGGAEWFPPVAAPPLP